MADLATLPVHVMNDEPRVLDTDLAERLGLSRPTNIRSDLIEPNRAELEGFGHLQAVTAKSSGRGRPGTAYYLNEEQALLVAILSKAPRAAEVRSMVIRTFVAVRRGAGAAIPPDVAELIRRTDGISRMLAHKVTEIEKAIPALVDSAIEAAIAADPRVSVVDYKPALEVLKDHGVPVRKRRAFSQRVSSQLRRHCAIYGYKFRVSRETGRYMFHDDGIRSWLEAGGASLIQQHKAAVIGQGVLPFTPKGKK